MNKNSDQQINKWPGLKSRRNFFSADTLQKIKSKISNAHFEKVYQERESHYSHVFKSANKRVTEIGEVYISNYYQAFDRETQEFLKNSISPIIGREIKKIIPNIKNIMPPQLMRFSKGSFLPIHANCN